MKYSAPPTTIQQQLELLRQRGLVINDFASAEAFLNKVGYYRFAGYALHFEEFRDRKRTHTYKSGSSFTDVVSLYKFDSALRRLLFSAIENIEIAFRSQLCLKLALDTNDSHWQLNPALFTPHFDHTRFLVDCEKEAARSRELFIKSYQKKYTEPVLPASWMLMEIVSFGTWSKMYSSLRDKRYKKDIAAYFKLKPFILESWIHSITVIRNLCAHHARIWNRSLTIKPRMTARMEKYYSARETERERIVLILDIISELLKPLGMYEEFINELYELIHRYPVVTVASMGLKHGHIEIKNGVRQ